MKITRTILIALLLLVAAPAAAEAWVGNVFVSPSGNLVCKFQPTYRTLTCGRFNDQRIVSISETGRAREGWRLDWRGQATHTLAYGSQYRTYQSRITCTMAINGVRCTNYYGHGFFLSRAILNTW